MHKTYRKISGMILAPAILLYIFSAEICQAGTVTYNYIYTPDDELVSISESDGNSTKVTNLSYDPNGNLTAIHDPSSKVQGFGYNDLNQLIRYVDQAEGRDFSYLYNAESLRSKKINASTNKQLSFYYDSSGNVINEADGTDISAYLMAHDRLLRATGTDIYWYVRNGKDIVGTTSDGTKQNNTYSYTAYGKDIDLNSPGNSQQATGNSSSSNIQNSTSDIDLKDNPFKYSATYQDFESGLYYMKARYYSPELMRFISKDTYDLSNKYAYGNGNPISNYDPSGHNALSFALSLFALVVSAISTVVTFGSASPSLLAAGMAFAGLAVGAVGSIEEGVKNTQNGQWSDWQWKSEDTLSNVFNIIGVVADVTSVASLAISSTARISGGAKFTEAGVARNYKWSARGGFTPGAVEQEVESESIYLKRFEEASKEQELKTYNTSRVQVNYRYMNMSKEELERLEFRDALQRAKNRPLAEMQISDNIPQAHQRGTTTHGSDNMALTDWKKPKTKLDTENFEVEQYLNFMAIQKANAKTLLQSRPVGTDRFWL